MKLDVLKRKVILSVGWVIILRYSSRLLDIGKYFIITRIFSPSDLGTFLLATTIALTFEALADTGFHFAFIQKQAKIQYYAKTLWVLSILRGMFIGILIISTSYFFSIFFKSSNLFYLLLMISLVPIIKGFQSPYVLNFQKELDFKKEFFFKIFPLIASSIAMIVLAYLTQNIFGLVLALVLGSFLEVVLSFYITSKKFTHPFSLKRAKYLINYGKHLTAGGIFTFLVTQIDSLFVGRVFGTAPLAAYELSFKLANVAFSEFTDIVSRVSFPLFAKIKNDKNVLLKAFKKNLFAVIIPAFAVTLVILIFAEPILRIAFGSQYESAAPILRILSVYGFLRAIIGPLGPLFLAVDRPQITTAISMINFIALIILIYPLSEIYGVNGVAVAMVVAYALTLPYAISSMRNVFVEKR